LLKRDQLANLFKKAKMPMDEKELNLLFDYFDKAKKGRFNFQSFVDGLKLIHDKASNETYSFDLTYPYVMEELKNKMKTLVQTSDNARQLDTGFNMHHESDGGISKENFKNVLLSLTKVLDGNVSLSEDELELLIHSEHVEKKGNHINFKKFLSKFKERDNIGSLDLSVSRLNESEFITSVDKEKLRRQPTSGGSFINRPTLKQVHDSGNTIFKSIANIIKTNKELSQEKIFLMFDKDGNKKISKQEFIAIFKEMKLPVTEKQIQDLMEYADKNRSGEVDFAEFKAGLQRNWS